VKKLAHIKNEIELLSISCDPLMERILSKIGFDVDYPVVYIPSKHRDMQNNVAVGFMAVGEISLNRSFINSDMCSVTERLVASSYLDPSMTRELSNLMGNHINFKALIDEEGEYDGEELPSEMLEPDREVVTAQIEQLADLRDYIRGSMYNEAGDLKTYDEYKQSA
jgi:hypothetical protein